MILNSLSNYCFAHIFTILDGMGDCKRLSRPPESAALFDYKMYRFGLEKMSNRNLLPWKTCA